ncbi:HNH endonuclease [Streptomyces sp. NPDC059173]|uniref:HNH endonuclease n=1 Tax=Streptomyces sp. NPDC059173 TaxID=3346756 RepID=UPI0036C4BA98
MECHHVVPLHEAGEGRTKLNDLALICANCHRMIHRCAPWPTPDKLRFSSTHAEIGRLPHKRSVYFFYESFSFHVFLMELQSIHKGRAVAETTCLKPATEPLSCAVAQRVGLSYIHHVKQLTVRLMGGPHRDVGRPSLSLIAPCSKRPTGSPYTVNVASPVINLRSDQLLC